MGIWANNLRRQYTIKQQCTARSIPYKGYLSTARIDTLTEAGFDFKSLTERTFQLRLKDLKKFKERYGHVNVPEVYVENKELGYWVTNLRSLYRRRYDENYKQFPCKCGSKNCCGYIIRAESRWRIKKKFAMSNRKKINI